MRHAVVLVALLTPWMSLFAQEDAKILTPEAAAKRIDERVIVQMEVKSTGGNTARYLNSEIDYRSDKNFAIFIPQAALARFRKADVEDPGQYYKGKTVQVTGTVTLSTARGSSGKPEVRVDDPAQIKVVEKGAEETKPKTAPKAVKSKGGKPK